MITKNRLTFDIFEKFVIVLNDIVSIYVLIYFVKIVNEISIMISQKMKKFEIVFSSKSTIRLLKHDEYNYAINLISNKTFSHKSLYKMFQKKFEIFQNNVKKNLISNKIKYSMIDANAFVFFVFKKKRKITIVCRLSKFERYYDKKQNFFIIDKRNVKSFDKNRIFHEIRFEKCLSQN